MNPELLGYLILSIAVFDQSEVLLSGVIAIETLVVGLHPDTFLRINIETIDTALDTPLAENGGRIASNLLCNGIKATEIHTLLQPQIAIDILPDLVDIVVTQRGRIIWIRIEGTETVAIISVQTIGGTYPNIALRVLEQIINLGV